MRYLCLTFLILFVNISAQTEIRGFVFSESRQPISRAHILLTNQENEIITFVFSNKDGSFLLKTNAFGNFKVEISAMGRISKKIPVSFIKRNTEIDFQEITLMSQKTNDIKEVVITRNKPISIKKDTIEYAVKSFSNGAEQNVEELLKKLPGITVLSNGKIKFQDKEVESVMVENDDLFEKGYQTLTQNMPSKPLEKVQVLQNYSKNKLLKNIEKTERVAINLTLKEDAKGQWFGNLLLASTSYKERMRQGKINVMNFSKKKKIYLLYNINNLGVNEMSGVDYLIEPSSDTNAENVGTNTKLNPLVEIHQKNREFEDNRTNFNNDQLASLNYIYNFKKDWKLKWVTIFNNTENKNYVNSSYKFNYENLQFENIENKTWKQNIQNWVGKIELSKEFKRNANLLFYNKISSQTLDNDNLFRFNEEVNNQKGRNNLFSEENRLVYTKKIDSSKAWVAVGRFLFQDRPFYFTENNQFIKQIVQNPKAAYLQQNGSSTMTFGGAKLSYLKKYKENHSLEIQIGDEWRSEKLFSDLKAFDVDGLAIGFDNALFFNKTELTQNSSFGVLKYKKELKKWNYNLDLNTQFLNIYFNNENKSYLQFTPTFDVGFKDKRIGNFNLNISRKVNNLAIRDLYVNFIYSGDRNFVAHENGFATMPNTNFSLTYTRGNRLSNYFTISGNYTFNEEYLANNMIVNPDFTFNQKILVKNNSTWFFNAEARHFLKLISSRISILSSYSNSNYENCINNQDLIKTEFSNLKLGFEVKSGWLKFFNYELGYDWSFNKTQSTINSATFKDEKGFANFFFNLRTNLRLESNLEFYKYGNTQQKTVQFLDFKANYQVKKYQFNLFVKANNILNSASIQRYSVNNVSESRYSQRLLPRNIVFGIDKNF